ncbi:DUF4382 domain-containing protein, partial [Vibrio sp.]|nr:DUF4382 domain-containing protein [Vibrio sp.]
TYDQDGNDATGCHHGHCVSDIDEANVLFNYVFLKPVNNGAQAKHVEFNDDAHQLRNIDIVNQNGEDADTLFDGMIVEPGTYEMCLYVNGAHNGGAAVETELDSHVIEKDGVTYSLSTPSQGSCEGAKPPKDARQYGRLMSAQFVVEEGKENQLAFVFDLEEQLVYNKNHDWRLDNSVRFDIVHEDITQGHIVGSMNVDGIMKQCHEQAINNGYDYAILDKAYLYKGDVEENAMGGVHSLESERTLPHQTAMIATPLIVEGMIVEGSGAQASFTFEGIVAGEYSVGYTCTAKLDTDADNAANFTIFDAEDVNVVAGQTSHIILD